MLLSRRSAAAACLLLFLTPAMARAQSVWEDRRADLGGWLDNSTGLVWGQNLTSYLQVSGVTWNGAVVTISEIAEDTDTPWRLPTVNELVDASDNGAFTVFGFPNYRMWSSEQTKNKKTAYAVSLKAGVTTLLDKRSAVDAIPVYQAFVP